MASVLMVVIENLKLECACVCPFMCMHSSSQRQQAFLKTWIVKAMGRLV